MANQAMRDDEVQLRRRARRRLIGAITLVTVMVVALPMVLDGEPRQSGQDIEITIPPRTSGSEFSSRIVPVPEQAKPASAPAENVAPAAEPVAPAPPPAPLIARKAETPPARSEEKKAEIAPAAKPVKAEEAGDKTSPAAEAKPKPKEALPHKDEKSVAARQEDGLFVIQLGAFANMANAKERQAKLTALKIKFYTETVKTSTGDKLRVRAGPYSTRQDAERVQAKLKASGIEDGVVAEKKG